MTETPEIPPRSAARMKCVAYITSLSGVIDLFPTNKAVRIWECVLIHGGQVSADVVMRIQDAGDTSHPVPRMKVLSPTSAGDYRAFHYNGRGMLFPRGARLAPEGTFSPGFPAIEHAFICNYEEVDL